MELGFRSAPERRDVPAESLMITGDINVVDLSLVVQYRIKDLDAFVTNVDDPEECPDGSTLRDATETAIRQVVGKHRS